MKQIIKCWMRFVALLALAAPVRAADLHVNYEHFTWTEEDTDGTRLLKEDGPLFGIGIAGEMPVNKRVELAGRLDGFLGEVDYDGQTQIGDPVRTTTGYYGLEGGFDGRLVLPATKELRLLPLAGLGARAWLRRLDTSGRDSAGYDEEWFSTYARAGLRATWTASTQTQFFAEAAVRMPFYNFTYYDITLDDSGEAITLNPGLSPSIVAEAGAACHGARVSLFYEQLTFSRSDSKIIPPYEILQPESHGQIIGLRIGIDL